MSPLLPSTPLFQSIPAPGAAAKPRSFFDKLNDWARGEGAAGLGYIIYGEDGGAKGPIAKNLDAERLAQIKSVAGHRRAGPVIARLSLMCSKAVARSEENTSELQSLMRISYDV